MTEPVRPTAEIEGLQASQAALLAALPALDESTLRQPSLLPGWTVGHVLGHLVGNAHSLVRRLRGVTEDRVVDQYPGGADGRAAEIEALALLPLEQRLTALRESCAEVEQVVDAVPDGAWDRLSRGVSGSLNPATAVLFSRWREVEVHHVDLGLRYTPADWPEALVARWLPDALAGLADPTALVAWVAGRGPAPDLQSWG